MAIYKCLVNGSIDEPVRSRVVEGLEQITTKRFGDDPDGVVVEFVEVEPGRWFTAGRPSSASMVLGSVPAGTSQDVRTELMDEIANHFSQATGADVMDVMVVAANAKTPRS